MATQINNFHFLYTRVLELLTVIQTLLSKNYEKILRVLNAVGGYHLQDLYLSDEEERVLKLITRLVDVFMLISLSAASRAF